MEIKDESSPLSTCIHTYEHKVDIHTCECVCVWICGRTNNRSPFYHLSFTIIMLRTRNSYNSLIACDTHWVLWGLEWWRNSRCEWVSSVGAFGGGAGAQWVNNRSFLLIIPSPGIGIVHVWVSPLSYLRIYISWVNVHFVISIDPLENAQKSDEETRSE